MHANEPEMAKKWEKKKKNEAERDYKDEYKKFQSSTKAKKYRAELNKYNRKKGTYGNGDGKDASHKGGKIVGFESQSKNRGRAEKSRLKKESPDFNPMIDKILDEVIDEYQLNEGPNQMTQVYKDLDKKFKNYDHTRIQHFGKVSKYLKDKFSKGSSLPDTIASFYNDYRGGEDMKKNIAKLTKYAKKMKGYAKESVNEDEMNDIIKLLVKYGNKKSEAIKMAKKHYDYVSKKYKNAKPVKKAEIISSLSTNESVNEAFRPSDKKVLMVIGRDTINKLRKKNPDIDRPDKQLGQAINAIFRAMTREKSDANYKQYKKYFPKYNDKLLRRLAKAYFDQPFNVQNTFMRQVMDYTFKESVDEGRPKYGKLKLTKDKPKKITQRIWSAPKRIMSKRAWLRMPDMNKMRKNGVDYVATSIGPKKTQVYIPVIFESVNEDLYYGYYKNKEVKVNAKSDKDAKKQIISKLKIPKGDLKRASMINHTKNQKNRHKFESVDEKVTYHDGGRTVGIDVRDLYNYLLALKKANPAKFKKDMQNRHIKAIFKRYSKGGEMYQEGFGGELKGKAKQKFEKARKENAEVLGYKLTGKSDINEVNIKDIQSVLKKKQAKKINGMYMDMTTANAIMTVYKALNKSNQKKFTKLPLRKMVDVTWKLVK